VHHCPSRLPSLTFSERTAYRRRGVVEVRVGDRNAEERPSVGEVRLDLCDRGGGKVGRAVPEDAAVVRNDEDRWTLGT
jgi:hypothetical protein